jgi:tetratricopeptide (TPR) repeat protein
MLTPIRFPFAAAALLLAFALSPVALVVRPAPGPAQQTAGDFNSFARSAASARESGHAADAISLYQRALGLRPDWAEGWWYLGTLLYDGDQFPGALAAFQKLVALAPGAPGAFSFLGLCEFETGDYDSALQHLQKGSAADRQDDPQLTRVVSFHLALLLNRAGKFDRALELLSKDVSQGATSDQLTLAFGLALLHVRLLPAEVDPSKDALLHAVGRLGLLVAEGHASEAAEAYPQLLSQYPDVSFLHAAYAEALRSADRAQEAAAQSRLERKLPSPTPSALAARYANKSSSNPSADSSQLALQLFAAGRFSEAMPALKSWLAQQPDSGTAWAMLGLCEFENKDLDNALLHLQKGTAFGLNGAPDSVRFAKYRLGLLLIHNARFDRASTLLIPEAEGNSLARQIQFALGLALLHKKLFPEEVPGPEIPLVQSAGEVSVLLHGSKYDAAFPILLRLIKSYPAAPMLHYVYGVALASLSRYDDAEVQFTEEPRISPDSELPYVQRAFVQLQVHRPAEALLSAQRAVQLAPNSAEAHYVLGRSLLDSGKLEDAMKELQAAAQLNPGSPEVHFNLAKVYAKLNRREDAERERALFATLNAEIEKQRSQQGNQAYGAAHTASELSQGSPPPSSQSPAPPP